MKEITSITIPVVPSLLALIVIITFFVKSAIGNDGSEAFVTVIAAFGTSVIVFFATYGLLLFI